MKDPLHLLQLISVSNWPLILLYLYKAGLHGALAQPFGPLREKRGDEHRCVLLLSPSCADKH